MTIIRAARPAQNFTIISNEICLNPMLSMRGLGLLVRLLSRPDNWHTNSETLAREFDVGREQMQKVLKELADLGYMRLQKTRQKNGTITSAWHVFDTPETGAPKPGKPAPGKPYAGKPVASNKTDLTSTDNKSITNVIDNHAQKDRLKISKPEGVTEQAWQDFLAVRKAAKAPLTKTAIEAIEKEARKASLCLQEAIEMCCQRGWRGFKAEWIKNGFNQSGDGFSFAERDKIVGMQRWEEMCGERHPDLPEKFSSFKNRQIFDVTPKTIDFEQ